MSLNPRYSALRRAAMLDSITAQAAGGKLRLYTGSQPADADAAIGAVTQLAELVMGSPAFGSATSSASTDSVLTANAITADSDADATGAAAWFRLWKSDGTTPLYDGTVGTATSDLVLNSVNIQIHAAVSVTSMTLTMVV